MTTTPTKEEKLENLVSKSGLTKNEVLMALSFRIGWGSLMGLTVATNAIHDSRHLENRQLLIDTTEEGLAPTFAWLRHAYEILGVDAPDKKGAIRRLEQMTQLEYCQVIADYLKDK